MTGGSGGIGNGICRRLAADGFNVAVHYGTDKDSAVRVCAEIQASGGRAIIASANVAEEADVASLFAKVVSRFGGVDIVVANAGTSGFGPIADVELADFEKLIAVNVRGAFLTLREAARTVRDNGRIIFTSSQLAERPRQGTGIYSATKAAVDAMLSSLSNEVGKRNITVNSVRPGATSPGMFDDSDEAKKQEFVDLSAFGRLGTPEDIASVVSFLAGSDGKWITGQHIRADGGMSN
ncbi:3-oxoacyl-[acyl-carrier-protein] reductase FabG [Aureliella helgolandensis]|uniref:3-oxoacyl-[acyl-carrier-protein] reductase FabG n=1 Tax=Aureliella helgolandensis TaxID=2527968 RepID=A0A518GB54_9BACT|nr:3-oxoacyl-[acyl-carrier-protein] reductase FabG [Aureliella helgolandensis]